MAHYAGLVAAGLLKNPLDHGADIVNFSHHHAMLPLVSERTQWLQIRMHQEMMSRVWGITPGEAIVRLQRNDRLQVPLRVVQPRLGDGIEGK